MERKTDSGTTGLPKAAALSHNNLIAQHMNLVFEQVPKPYTIRRILALPMFHAACVPVAHTSAERWTRLCHNGSFRTCPLFNHVKAYKLNELALVPPIAIAIIMSGLAGDKLKAVKHTGIGAAPLGKESQERLKIIDEEGNDITAYDVRGKPCVRGPTVISVYFCPSTSNFFKTGDIMYCDSGTKKWYIVDRKKELIKVRGFQVAPPEFDGIKGSAGDGEMPRAYKVKRPVEESKRLEEKYVREWCGKRLARHKELTGGVRRLDFDERLLTSDDMCNGMI
ncbi:AMP-binding enzyme [Sclerotinia borealis F-4128]|uniref:AMP-binding enzyme n=1 Tax=Sclerotinia borealis (strain F-4128) TaxID=1432307 RepID=W9CQF0_SCLBF|nr:AMP-binding enzyme [Sclerotinia borealis F-4128]